MNYNQLLKKCSCYFKLVALLLLVCSSITVFGVTKTGCSDGDNIYPDFSGTNFFDCTTCVAVPIYNTTNVIPMRYGSGDTNCGILRGNFTSLGKRCKINRGPGNTPDGAGLVSYEESNNSCQVPIDSNVAIFAIALMCVGSFKIRKQPLRYQPQV